MGWSITPNDYIISSSVTDNKLTVNFGKNTSSTDINYHINYTDEYNCGADEKQYSLPYCEVTCDACFVDINVEKINDENLIGCDGNKLIIIDIPIECGFECGDGTFDNEFNPDYNLISSIDIEIEGEIKSLNSYKQYFVYNKNDHSFHYTGNTISLNWNGDIEGSSLDINVEFNEGIEFDGRKIDCGPANNSIELSYYEYKHYLTVTWYGIEGTDCRKGETQGDSTMYFGINNSTGTTNLMSSGIIEQKNIEIKTDYDSEYNDFLRRLFGLDYSNIPLDGTEFVCSLYVKNFTFACPTAHCGSTCNDNQLPIRLNIKDEKGFISHIRIKNISCDGGCAFKSECWTTDYHGNNQ